MAEPSKALRQVLLASVQSLTVTRSERTGADSVVVDPGIVASAGLLANEKVDVLNVTTGARFSTALAVSQKAPGGVEVLGPAAHFAAVGDVLVLSAWAWMKEKSASRHQPRMVLVDARNRVVAPAAKAGSTRAAPSPEPIATPGKARRA